MNVLVKFFNWKVSIIFSSAILLILTVLSFYGIHSNEFYFLKPDNYIFPILAIIHFFYLYMVWFKITEGFLPDPKMRNVEYALYVILIVYFFKIYDSTMVLSSMSVYSAYIVPATFKPLAILSLVLYCMLPLLTLYTFWLRKRFVGPYNFENYNDNLNIWQ